MAQATVSLIKAPKVSTIRKRKISLLVEENPKRPNTKSHERFDLYKEGMTVEDFLEAGGIPLDIKWDIEHGYIEVSEE